MHEFLLHLYLLHYGALTRLAGAEPMYEEDMIGTATRIGRLVEDEPLRVEVVPSAEIQENIMMTPGDVSMLPRRDERSRSRAEP